MAFNLKGVKDIFKRKKTDEFRGSDFEISSDPQEDIKFDGHNPFEEGNKGDISFAEKDTRLGRKLKSKYVIAIAAVVVLIGVGSVVSNLLAPDTPLPTQEQKRKVHSAKDDIGLAGSGIPSNYEELAKFEQDERKKQEELARQKKEKEEEERRKKMKEEKARQEAEARARANEQNRTVQTPRVNINRPVVTGPVGPSKAEEKAYSSSIGFNMGAGGGSVGGTVASYLSGNSSNIDMSASYSVNAGTVIPATLLSGVTSDGSTDVVAQVRQDVFDSLTGQHLLIPQGSRLLGVVSQSTNRRIGVNFKRIILPDGTSIKLPEQRAVDKSGYAGMKDKYDSHDSTFFRSALISGVMSYLADEVDSKAGRSSKTSTTGSGREENYKTALNETVENITDRIMERSDRDANRNPTITIRPGFQFNVFINEDFVAYEYIR